MYDMFGNLEKLWYGLSIAGQSFLDSFFTVMSVVLILAVAYYIIKGVCGRKGK